MPTWFWLPISRGSCVWVIYPSLLESILKWSIIKASVVSAYFCPISFNNAFLGPKFLSGCSCRFVLSWKNIPPINLFLLSYHMVKVRCLTRHSMRRRWKGFAWRLNNRFVYNSEYHNVFAHAHDVWLGVNVEGRVYINFCCLI